jgi:two-component system CheB/CheR fusion protein
MKAVVSGTNGALEHDGECLRQRGDVPRPGADRDRLLAVMSHELKQPLTELLLNAELLLQLAPESEFLRLQAIGEAMRRLVRRQLRVIDDLLEFSRARTGKLHLEPLPVDLASMVRDACMAARQGATGLELSVEIPGPDEILCMADPVRVEQILSNLLGNAVKFSAGRGRIDVQLVVDGHCARISVTDAGCGIAADFLPHVFGLFDQDRRRQTLPNPGFGIGLSLVRELVLAHGGRVDARSDGPGCGACFLVWLPLLDTVAAKHAMTPVADAGLMRDRQHDAFAGGAVGALAPDLALDPTASIREPAAQPN